MDFDNQRNEYLNKAGIQTDAQKYRALKYAHEIRKFEIEMYWKRASYFWVFIALAFTGYIFTFYDKESIDKIYQIMLRGSIAMFGMVFSLAWVLVNLGSKFWQNHWERSIDYLEDDFTGSLYKTVITELCTNCNFSVSKINLYVSWYVFIIWCVFFLKNIIGLFIIHADHMIIHYVLGALILLASIVTITTMCRAKSNHQMKLHKFKNRKHHVE